MVKIKPRISVVIPAYNEEKYLPKCLDSFKKQSFRDFELIVVDNNSTDSTPAIAQKYGARVVTEKQKGTLYAQRTGFNTAIAPIIARTDADCMVSDYWLEIIYDLFETNPNLVAVTGAFSSPYEKIPDSLFELYTKIFSEQLGKVVAGKVNVFGANMAIRKSAWDKVKHTLKDPRCHEDIALGFQAAKLGEVRYVPELTLTVSLRKLEKTPLAGLREYLIRYPKRYFHTVLLNNPYPRLERLGKKFRHLRKKTTK